MGMTWTDDQRKVIELRDRNILVSAAAGSGKTAVLVERIIKIITDKEHPVDIDRLLIVTFTNAAAAEMRERIGNALENALKEQPDDALTSRSSIYAIGNAPASNPLKQKSNGTVSADEVIGTPR